jgi:hypothetical protein
MTDEASNPSSEPIAGRRAADVVALKFKEAELKSFAMLETSFHESDVEIIDMDGALPCGSDDDFHQAVSSSAPARAMLTPEQKKQRLQLSAFKQSFETFEVTSRLSRVNIAEIKRGDVVAIKTVVGKIFLRIIDRIKGELPGTGEILCECHYDLSDQYNAAHAASIQLPICVNSHVIVNPDGSTRLASRKLKMSTDTILPPHVANLLHERFFVEMSIYANPKSEKLRLVDLGRWITRVGLKLKAIVDENNRVEREKKQRKEEDRRRKKEEKQDAVEADKNR